MIWILFAILSSASIFVIFKLLQRFSLPTLPVILVNYIVATFFGFWLAGGIPHYNTTDMQWLLPAIIIGVLFIVNFFLMAYSAQNIGISITTVAGKMSVIIPMVFSIYFYSEDLPAFKIIGIVLAMAAVFMAVFKKDNGRFNPLKLIVPLIIFASMGVTDALLKYAQDAYISDDKAPVFSASLFGIALILAFLFLTIRPKNFVQFSRWPVWLAGLVLGLVNFGSVYFVILALNSKVFDSSIVFGITNICIVTISALVGGLVFREKLSVVNIVGIVLSVAAIAIFMWT
ncbi:MAG TPA: DMT family transporter [Bacteroidales bacterium]|nr:DMT family transporter [Bacteroidales bacterium]